MSESPIQNRNHSIKCRFDRRADSYDSVAGLQREVAGHLIDALKPWRFSLPRGPVLEFGAGTGFLTEKLIDTLPDSRLTVTDISESMIDACMDKVATGENVEFKVFDAEQESPPGGDYALITGNFVAQWFTDPAETLKRLSHTLASGGLLLTSFPGEHCFPEWREVCDNSSLPWTRNRMPDIDEILIKLSTGPFHVDFHEDSKTLFFDTSFDFFKSLKKLGATVQMDGCRLSAPDFRLLMRQWDSIHAGSPVKVTYHLVFLAVRKN